MQAIDAHTLMTAKLEPVLAAFGAAGAGVRRIGSGLINQTYAVEAGPAGRFVLQRLHQIFRSEVNEDIDVVTRHLEARGLVTPRLIPTCAGRLSVEHDGAVWRAMTWVEGTGLDFLESPAQACEAGRVLAQFHCAVSDLQHQFRGARIGVHDTPMHLANLRIALADHRTHARFDVVAPLAQQILAAAAALPHLPGTPERIVHGDPKVNNILFAADRRRAICLIDLDTLTHMALPLELGDAFRSWCNPAGEDHSRAWFSLDLFEAAVAGYAAEARGFVTAVESRSIVTATQIIYIELAARFCADALNESYFGWNAEAFGSRSEHNQIRAESQLNAARSLQEQQIAAETAVRKAFSG